MSNIIKQIISTIDRAERILLMPSSPVDADCIGSALALYLSFKKLSKSITVVCADLIPDVYNFLPSITAIQNKFSPSPDFVITIDCSNTKIGSLESNIKDNKFNIILTPEKGSLSEQNLSFSQGPAKYDLIITVDTASTTQLGRFYEDNIQLFSQIPVINIDHHASNEGFGRINFVDIMSSSTTELVYQVIEELENHTGAQLLDDDIATLLLSGIITDTGSFQNSNTTPKSFSAAAKLIKHGARQQEIIQHIFKTKQLTMLKLWGRILSNIVNEEEHGFVWSVITRKDFMETGGKEDDTGGIIDELMSNAPGTEIVLLLKEKEGKVLSGSIRSTNDSIDVSQIAERFGGGGHTRAAGFKIKNADFASTGKEIIDTIKSIQASRRGLNQSENQIHEDIQPKAAAHDFSNTLNQLSSMIDSSSTPTETTADSQIEEQASSFTRVIKATEENQKFTPGTKYRFEN